MPSVTGDWGLYNRTHQTKLNEEETKVFEGRWGLVEARVLSPAKEANMF